MPSRPKRSVAGRCAQIPRRTEPDELFALQRGVGLAGHHLALPPLGSDVLDLGMAALATMPRPLFCSPRIEITRWRLATSPAFISTACLK